MSEDMRGLFFIVKGQYEKGVKPSFINSVSGNEMSVGGYDPENKNTQEWYRLMDRKTYTTLCCSGDLDNVLRGVYKYIKKFKGDTKKYLEFLNGLDNLFSSPTMRCMYEHIDNLFGDYYSDEVREMEDLAFSELKEERNPVRKNRKLVSKHKKEVDRIDIETPQRGVVLSTTTPKKVKPKVVLGLKKLNM